MHRPPAAALGVALLAATGLVLAGCSTDTSTPAASATEPAPSATVTVGTANQADIEFAQMMIVHHQGAVVMARTEVDNGQNTNAVDLAHQVVVDQTAEIALMQTLLDAE